MMDEIRRGRLDVVLCYKLDRLGRSLVSVAQLIGEMIQNKVALVIPGQGIDTSSDNSAARLQMNILIAVAEFERDIIRERTLAGLAAARSRGVKLGRPRLAISESTAKQLKEFARRRKAGGKETYRAVAARLGMSVGKVAFSDQQGIGKQPFRPTQNPPVAGPTPAEPKTVEASEKSHCGHCSASLFACLPSFRLISPQMAVSADRRDGNGAAYLGGRAAGAASW